MGAHVLDDAQHRHLNLLKHAQRLARVQEGDILGGGDNHRTTDRDALSQGQLDIAGPRRQVNDHVVHVPPIGLVEQLFQCLGHHGTTPDHGRLVIHQVTHGHGLHTVIDQGLHRTAVLADGLGADTQHARLVGAVDVRVQHRHVGPLRGQGQG